MLSLKSSNEASPDLQVFDKPVSLHMSALTGSAGCIAALIAQL